MCTYANIVRSCVCFCVTLHIFDRIVMDLGNTQDTPISPNCAASFVIGADLERTFAMRVCICFLNQLLGQTPNQKRKETLSGNSIEMYVSMTWPSSGLQQSESFHSKGRVRAQTRRSKLTQFNTFQSVIIQFNKV